MARGDPENLWQAICQKVFNTKTPSKKRLVYFLIAIILIFIIGFTSNFFLGKTYQSLFIDKASVHVSFDMYEKDQIGFFLPLHVINIGQKTLHNVTAEVESCYQNSKETYYYDILTPTQTEDATFRDLDTFALTDKKWCMKNYNFTPSNCNFDVYVVNSTTVYAPPQNCTLYICDVCEVKTTVTANELKESHNFSTKLFTPREVKLHVEPKEFLDINTTGLKRLTDLGLAFYTAREFCFISGNCSLHTIPDETLIKHLPYMDNTSIKIDTVSNASLTVSFSYANLGDILLEEERMGRIDNLLVSCTTSPTGWCPVTSFPSDLQMSDLTIEFVQTHENR